MTTPKKGTPQYAKHLAYMRDYYHNTIKKDSKKLDKLRLQKRLWRRKGLTPAERSEIARQNVMKRYTTKP